MRFTDKYLQCCANPTAREGRRGTCIHAHALAFYCIEHQLRHILVHLEAGFKFLKLLFSPNMSRQAQDRHLIRIRGPLIPVASPEKENKMGRPLDVLGNSVSKHYQTYTWVKDPEGIPHSGERGSQKSICGDSIWGRTVGADGGDVNLEQTVVVPQNMAPVLLVYSKRFQEIPDAVSRHISRDQVLTDVFIFCITPENACIWTMRPLPP